MRAITVHVKNGRNSARAACEFGFLECGLDRILAANDAPNVASVEVMKRLGMRFVEERLEGASPTVFYALDQPETVSCSYEISRPPTR